MAQDSANGNVMFAGMEFGLYATVDGGAHWVMCCPLCGCSHQLLGVDESAPYTPLCQTQPMLFKTELGVWLKQYPEVSKYSSLHLIAKAA